MRLRAAGLLPSAGRRRYGRSVERCAPEQDTSRRVRTQGRGRTQQRGVSAVEDAADEMNGVLRQAAAEASAVAQSEGRCRP